MWYVIRNLILLFICFLVLVLLGCNWVHVVLIFIAIFIFLIIAQIIKANEEKQQQRQHLQKLYQATNDNPILRTNMDTLSGESFEEYCADLLRIQGFSEIELTKTTGDNGIDIIAVKNNHKYGFQCKRYNSSVGVKAVQEAFAGANYYGCDFAAVITNNSFTRAAIDMADNLSVELWDRETISGIKDSIVDNTLPQKNAREDGTKRSISQRTILTVVAGCLMAGIIGFMLFTIFSDSSESDYDIDYNEYTKPTVSESYQPTQRDESQPVSEDEESMTAEKQNKTKISENPPYLYMREADIESTALGKPDKVEKSLNFDVMDEGHKSKEYTWGSVDDNTYWSVTVRYERHFSNNVDDVEVYPDDNGYVSSLYYYDQETGYYKSVDEYDDEE